MRDSQSRLMKRLFDKIRDTIDALSTRYHPTNDHFELWHRFEGEAPPGYVYDEADECEAHHIAIMKCHRQLARTAWPQPGFLPSSLSKLIEDVFAIENPPKKYLEGENWTVRRRPYCDAHVRQTCARAKRNG